MYLVEARKNLRKIGKANKMYYGLTPGMDMREMAEKVCDCLGYGANDKAFHLLLETAGAETYRGQVKDNTKYAGMGLTQFDKVPFYDIKDRTNERDIINIKQYFDIDIEYVEWEHLRYNPLLALIFTRLKYKKIPDLIPNNFEGRAEYWKQYYNTYAGKGTPEHYIKCNEMHRREDDEYISQAKS